MMMKRGINIISRFLIIPLIFLVACAGPKPVLYPNNHFEQVGRERADQDVAECEEWASEYVSQTKAGEKVAGQTVAGGAIGAASGAVGGAIVGSAGLWAAIGAAVGATQGLLVGLFRAGSSDPSPAYQNFVNRCLKEQGYEPMGWD
jgi:outer membrane lipoprotein SlyB